MTMVSVGSTQSASKKGETRADGRVGSGCRGFQQTQPSSCEGAQIWGACVWPSRTWASQACRTRSMVAPRGSGGASQRFSSGPQQHAQPGPISRPARSRTRAMVNKRFTKRSLEARGSIVYRGVSSHLRKFDGSREARSKCQSFPPEAATFLSLSCRQYKDQ